MYKDKHAPPNSQRTAAPRIKMSKNIVDAFLSVVSDASVVTFFGTDDDSFDTGEHWAKSTLKTKGMF
jgi:hypothetical protein